jgi:salicylate hydroxylase
MGSTGDKKTLKCAVVGAGIAGLGAAIALRRAGHEVEIFEKSTFKQEIGAAISMTPNSNYILGHWGFDFQKAGETEKKMWRQLDPQTLEETRPRVYYDDIPSRFNGHRFSAYNRVDMHNEMRRLAEEAGAVIHLGKQAVDADCKEGVLHFADGESVERDLIVIADGIKVSGHSIAVKT